MRHSCQCKCRGVVADGVFEWVDCRGAAAHCVEGSVDCGGPEGVVPRAPLRPQHRWWEKAVVAVMPEAVLKPHPQAGVLEGAGHSVRLLNQQRFLFLRKTLEDSQPSPSGALKGKQ